MALASANTIVGGKSPAFQKVMRLLAQLAPTQHTVLIHGATGTGKEVVAQQLHLQGANPKSPFVDVNCGAIPEQLIESELFGHTRGAFTGANTERQGHFATAQQGTLFLDEIGELPLSLQPKLLRVLETRTFRPVGATQNQVFKGRIIAATHQDLQQMVSLGKFREDLYQRLSVFVLPLPGLNQRSEDMPALVEHFLLRQPRKLDFSREAISYLCKHPWRGHVRELRNLIDRLALLSESTHITPSILKEFLPSQETQSILSPEILFEALLCLEGEDKLNAVEQFLIQGALCQVSGNKSAAAKLLGVHRKVIERRMQVYQDSISVAQEHLKIAEAHVALSAFTEAIVPLQQALKVLLNTCRQDDHRLILFRVYYLLGACYQNSEGWLSEDARSAYANAQSIGVQLGDSVDLMPVLFSTWVAQLMSLELGKARETAQDMLQCVVNIKLSATRGDAYFAMANTLFWLGDCEAALAILKQGKLFPTQKHEFVSAQGFDLVGLSLTFAGLCLFQLGHFDQAHEITEALIKRAQTEQSNMFHRAIALQGAAWLSCLFENYEQTNQLGSELEVLGKANGFLFYQGVGQVFKGCAMMKTGSYFKAEHIVQEGFEKYMLHTGGKLFHSFQAWQRAELLLRGDFANESYALATRAIELALACQERVYLSELFIIQARAMLQMGNAKGAEEGLQRALSTASVLGSVPAQIQALSYLTVLLQDQKRLKEADDLLNRSALLVSSRYPKKINQFSAFE